MRSAAEEAQKRAVGAQANPVSGSQHHGSRHRAIVDQRALAAAVAEHEGAMIEEDFAMARRDAQVDVAVEDEGAPRLPAEGKPQLVDETILALDMEARGPGI